MKEIITNCRIVSRFGGIWGFVSSCDAEALESVVVVYWRTVQDGPPTAY